MFGEQKLIQSQRLTQLVAIFFTLATTLSATAVGPSLVLGDKPSFGLFQPRVSAEILTADGTSLGPTATSFLLDTGASGVLIYPPATTQLAANGFVNEGQFEEAGLSGTSLFDVSAPYTLNFTGTESTEQITDIRFLSGSTSPDPTGLMGLNGIVGMPALGGRVTSLDNRTREGAISLSMGVTFSDELPSTNTHRFTVPLTELFFPAEGDVVPTFQSLSTLDVVSRHSGQETVDPIILDSGAQVTIINEAIANRLGIDTNGNGFEDEAIATVPLTGATGTINAPVVLVDEMRIPTDQGFDLVWRNAEVVIQDIDPRISGVLGADFMTGDGGLDFSAISGGGLGGLGGLEGLEGLEGLGGLSELLELLGGGDGGLGDLLGGIDIGDLLGGGLGGGTDTFASFPLESFFDQVHFDFRNFPEASGQLVFDVNNDISRNILNGDHVFDVADIDDLTAAIGDFDFSYDMNEDGIVTFEDRDSLVSDVFRTVPGDTDLDQDVDFADFLALSSAFGADGGWGEGDFDGNGSIEFADFLAQSANFGFSAAAQPSSVPEPSAGLLGLFALFAFQMLRRRRV